MQDCHEYDVRKIPKLVPLQRIIMFPFQYHTNCYALHDMSLHSQPDSRGLKYVFKNVYWEGGMRALYRGVGSTLVGIPPYAAGLKFYIYEELKRRVPEEHQNFVMLRLSCGALARLFEHTFTYPLDVFRRQKQSARRWSWVHEYDRTFTTIIRNQGWGQLFVGSSINYMTLLWLTLP
ncbi:hypothetical protein MKW94_008401 [Papaver nudicaule]|uniref:Mitochondrial carrier protein n=1 Tax=Papaver nudicaule TaxID=74823 RepID=A0AA41SB88_PAPNU|nr:hypothetical protein [Papaver nudicaule]